MYRIVITDYMTLWGTKVSQRRSATMSTTLPGSGEPFVIDVEESGPITQDGRQHGPWIQRKREPGKDWHIDHSWHWRGQRIDEATWNTRRQQPGSGDP